MSSSPGSGESRFRRSLKRYRRNLAQFGRRFARNKLALASVGVIVALSAIALMADILYDYEFITTVQLSNSFKSPGTTAAVTFRGETFDHRYLLGADNYGRDILGRMIHGGRISLIIGFFTVAMSLLVGGVMGALAGYKGGFIDTIVMRITDIMLSIPTILLSIAIVAALGNSFFNLLVAIATSMMPRYARIVRASVISVKDQEFIEAARCIGAGDFRIVTRHVLINILAPVIVQSTLNVGSAILWAASLSFLGLGILPPTPEWGNMLSEAREFIKYAPHTLLFPGLAIMITVLAYNLIGDGLRDSLDPKLKR